MGTDTERWLMFAVLSIAASGCATTPQKFAQKVTAPIPQCMPCGANSREVERLRQELEYSNATVRELRSDQRVQVNVLQASKREITRAKVKLRRLATRADAASFIAELEVAIEALRPSRRTMSKATPLVEAQRLLDSATAAFAQEDYASAMDRVAEAEQLVLWVAEMQPPRLSLARTKPKLASPSRMAAGSFRHY